jgi:hypothetical protein
MKWLKTLLGIKTPEERARAKITDYEQKAFEAQRKGDMEEAGMWKAKAEAEADKLYNTDITVSGVRAKK